MTAVKKELAVAALENGTVIDHIDPHSLFEAVRLLGLEKLDVSVTVGNNLVSNRLGRKGIIKVADKEFADDDLNRIALIAPQAVVNTIRNYSVVEKRQVQLPEHLVGLVKCSNPRCITNNEPMDSRFEVVDRNPVVLRCHYCNRCVKGEEAEIL